jgi:hypothetical protein
MVEEMNYDWETLLKDKSPDRKFDIFLEKINIAKEKCIPQTPSLYFNSVIPDLVFLFEFAY